MAEQTVPDSCSRCAQLEARIADLEGQIAVLRGAAPLPLRYRLVDAMNRVLHRVGLHRKLKRLVECLTTHHDAPTPSPEATPPSSQQRADPRGELADRYLTGEGIEIGALQNPLRVPARARVRYVDRLTLAEARGEYPELEGQPLVEPAIIAEADALTPVASASLDFVIANHVLEHLRDPISAIHEWLRVLRPGGHLYLAVPDKNNPFDRERTVTTLDHMIVDAVGSGSPTRAGSDHAHYLEWSRATMENASPKEQEARAADLEARRYAIHFHVFDGPSFHVLLEHVCTGLAAVVEARTNAAEPEHIAIIRRSEGV